jgi:TRAP-type C4-dicarboxylate transport system permease small subunit
MKTWLIVLIVAISLVIGWFTTTGVKSQWVRLADILLLGPLMIYAGIRADQDWVRVPLMIFGATTITYNLRNYINLAHKNTS